MLLTEIAATTIGRRLNPALIFWPQNPRKTQKMKIAIEVCPFELAVVASAAKQSSDFLGGLGECILSRWVAAAAPRDDDEAAEQLLCGSESFSRFTISIELR